MQDQPEGIMTTDVAAKLGIDASHVRRIAIRHNYGRKVSERVRLFSPADVEAIRRHLKGGKMGRPRKDRIHAAA